MDINYSVNFSSKPASTVKPGPKAATKTFPCLFGSSRISPRTNMIVAELILLYSCIILNEESRSFLMIPRASSHFSRIEKTNCEPKDSKP